MLLMNTVLDKYITNDILHYIFMPLLLKSVLNQFLMPSAIFFFTFFPHFYSFSALHLKRTSMYGYSSKA